MTATKSPIESARAHLKAGASPSQDDLKAAIADLESHAAEAEARLDSLTDDRERALVNAGAREVAAIDEKSCTERFTIEQTRAITVQVRAALDVVAERDRVAAILSRRDAVEALMKKSTAAQKEWLHLVEAIRTVLRSVAEADAAAENFARDYPDEPPIQRAESRVRWTPAERRVVSEERCLAWQRDDGSMLIEEGSRTVRNEKERLPNYTAPYPERGPNPDILSAIAKGELRATGETYRLNYGDGPRVVPVPVIKRTFEVHALDRPDDLAAIVVLPPLRVGESGYEAVSHATPAETLHALDKPARGRALPATEVELVPIDEAPQSKVLKLNAPRAA